MRAISRSEIQDSAHPVAVHAIGVNYNRFSAVCLHEPHICHGDAAAFSPLSGRFFHYDLDFCDPVPVFPLVKSDSQPRHSGCNGAGGFEQMSIPAENSDQKGAFRTGQTTSIYSQHQVRHSGCIDVLAAALSAPIEILILCSVLLVRSCRSTLLSCNAISSVCKS